MKNTGLLTIFTILPKTILKLTWTVLNLKSGGSGSASAVYSPDVTLKPEVIYNLPDRIFIFTIYVLGLSPGIHKQFCYISTVNR